MCTVTYIPQPEGNFILTSNRDENAARSPQNITCSNESGVDMIFPRDTAAGGTWIAAAEDSRVVCLLNGAFEKHRHTPPYRRSRGLMVLDFFTFSGAEDFVKCYDFQGIEPFTFIMAEENRLYDLRWDENQTHLSKLDPEEKYLWSSATLYPDGVSQLRQEWFRTWQENRNDFGLEAIQHFHRTGGEGDTWNGFIMNRQDRVQTVSITNVVKKPERIELIYHDLLRKTVKSGNIRLKINSEI